jgi:hypothetical protein
VGVLAGVEDRLSGRAARAEWASPLASSRRALTHSLPSRTPKPKKQTQPSVLEHVVDKAIPENPLPTLPKKVNASVTFKTLTIPKVR